LKILYYDCFAGISGDMNLGALIDLGVEPELLRTELAKLNIGRYRFSIERGVRKGISGTRIDVIVPSEHSSGHGHTTFKDIRRLIEESDLSGRVKAISLAIFMKLAEAEAKIHGHALDDVAFHEVGAVDSIVDIVGAAICLDILSVDRIFSSPVQLGGGFVKCAHGTLPVPAPATVEILKGIPIKMGLVPFETTTPTGAAILAATVDQFIERLDFTPATIGYGLGHRDTEVPNVLRVLIGEQAEALSDSDVEVRGACIIDTNIDDMSPETYDLILESLFAAGAQDVYLTPIIMKKSRPAVKISILCEAQHMSEIEEVLWLQTSTFGLRFYPVTKVMLRRDFSEVATKYGKISVKNAYWHGKRVRSKPEYEDCKKLAKAQGVTIRDILDSLPKDSK
jgi:pyridinium-3,5-bisthiocarboxylic acid mononucleotide nickel chelatase